ncbi:hypothetical protein L249_7682 [Ophiocordyceps polyrhachis-furcata BCC 54312]|uniref:Uncharacterized protein n=1 Tax=Ophiocordyceps polyrhachis-furcata BCC 54312 TaxID=1330021 RepID=A0A367LAX9_9HYPO|nr:hypothetical protein L249_7682 [Ophiocordyceps polyrhachis-furcata BCC 54312]
MGGRKRELSQPSTEDSLSLSSLHGATVPARAGRALKGRGQDEVAKDVQGFDPFFFIDSRTLSLLSTSISRLTHLVVSCIQLPMYGWMHLVSGIGKLEGGRSRKEDNQGRTNQQRDKGKKNNAITDINNPVRPPSQKQQKQHTWERKKASVVRNGHTSYGPYIHVYKTFSPSPPPRLA